MMYSNESLTVSVSWGLVVDSHGKLSESVSFASHIHGDGKALMAVFLRTDSLVFSEHWCEGFAVLCRPEPVMPPRCCCERHIRRSGSISSHTALPYITW